MNFKRVLLVSRHDYRTPWRANFHPIADAFKKAGADVSFISTGYSHLSGLRPDRRNELVGKANKWETVNGIRCFLWKSLVHPVRFNLRYLDAAADPLFRIWASSPCVALDSAAQWADLILVESDLSAALLSRIRKASPSSFILYVASDLLDTIGAAPSIGRALHRNRHAIDRVAVVSRGMIEAINGLGRPITYLPHGISPEDFALAGGSPYSHGKNAVSVGSMLFDKQVIETASKAFPDVRFHLIGSPISLSKQHNIIEHGVMDYRETIRWIKYADVGIAPYQDSASSAYLSDSSMKLRQYGFVGLPAVCPFFAVGDYHLRFGYRPDDQDSIKKAFQNALAADKGLSFPALPSWDDIVATIDKF